MATRRNSTIGAIVLVIVLIVVYTQITFFVIQPIGALPDGKTLVILRLNTGYFIDSADALCERIQGHVNLLCRAAVLGAVADNSTILLRLPYSETLHLISNNGKIYSK